VPARSSAETGSSAVTSTSPDSTRPGLSLLHRRVIGVPHPRDSLADVVLKLAVGAHRALTPPSARLMAGPRQASAAQATHGPCGAPAR